MADVGDRGDRGRRRRRRGGRKDRGPEKEPPLSQPLTKPPIILAKPPLDRDRERPSQSPTQDGSGKPSFGVDQMSEERERKPVVMLKVRERSEREEPTRPLMSTSPSIPSLLASEGTLSQPTYQIQRNPSMPPPQPVVIEGSSQGRLAGPPEMFQGNKLVDENLQWCDAPMEMLLEQTDLMTIGVIGGQGVGKSTVLSLFAGNNATDPQRLFVLKPQTKEVREVGAHQTVGIDLFVTSERVMLLDTQAVFSASILDHMIHQDKKFAAEYSSAENCLEMQSLMVGTFLLTVCNVVLVVMDGFADYDIFRFLQTAEMLRPPTPGQGHDPNTTHDDIPDHNPHIVFVLNKARREDFSLDNYHAMQGVLQHMFYQSKLKVRGSIGTPSVAGVTTGRGPWSDSAAVNLVLLPNLNTGRTNGDGALSLLSDYQGHPSLGHLVQSFRNSLFGIPRTPLTHATLSEKNWFHYAARTWEAIKKSQLLAEYNRLLP